MRLALEISLLWCHNAPSQSLPPPLFHCNHKYTQQQNRIWSLNSWQSKQSTQWNAACCAPAAVFLQQIIFWCEHCVHQQVLEVSDAAVFTRSVVVFAVTHLHMQKFTKCPFRKINNNKKNPPHESSSQNLQRINTTKETPTHFRQ